MFISSGTFFLSLLHHFSASSFHDCLFLDFIFKFPSFYSHLFPSYHFKMCSMALCFLSSTPPLPNFFLYQSLTPLLSHLVFSISLSLFITLEVLMRLDCYYVSSALFCSLVFYFVPCCTAYYSVTACCLDRSLGCLESYLDKAKKQC